MHWQHALWAQDHPAQENVRSREACHCCWRVIKGNGCHCELDQACREKNESCAGAGSHCVVKLSVLTLGSLLGEKWKL